MGGQPTHWPYPMVLLPLNFEIRPHRHRRNKATIKVRNHLDFRQGCHSEAQVKVGWYPCICYLTMYALGELGALARRH